MEKGYWSAVASISTDNKVEVIHLQKKAIREESFGFFLRQLRAKCDERPLHVFLDNLNVHTKKPIQELIERREFRKAKQARATKDEMVVKPNAAIAENRAKRDKLAEKIVKLRKEFAELVASHEKTTKMHNYEGWRRFTPMLIAPR